MPAIKKSLAKAKKVSSETTLLLNEVMREKMHKARKDTRAVALEVVQVLLALMVALAGLFFLFPEKPFIHKLLSLYYPPALVEEYLMQLPQPPWSYVLFAIVLAAALWVFKFTAWYRHERKQSKKLLTAEIILLFLIFASMYLYFDPSLNIIPAPLSYITLGALTVALIALLVYIRFFKS